jgi:hypothetical protein
MRAVIIPGNRGIMEYSGSAEGKQLSISQVLQKWGTQAMLALDRGETVHIITETREDQLNDRPGS